MRTNYMMTVDDVMEELGVKRSKAYSILKQLNDELAKEGYVAVRGKVLHCRIIERQWIFVMKRLSKLEVQ